jgi:hypothetical protein
MPATVKLVGYYLLREPPSWELSEQIFDKLVHLTDLCSNSPVEDLIVECPANLVPKLLDLEQQYLLLHMKTKLSVPTRKAGLTRVCREMKDTC